MISSNKEVVTTGPVTLRLNRREAAAYLHVSPSTLAVWTCTNRYNLPYVKVGRLVQYRLSDLDHFLESRTFGLPLSQ